MEKSTEQPVGKKQFVRINRYHYDDAISIYVILFFLLFLIAIISIWQGNKIDQLRKELDEMKNNPTIEVTHLQK